MSEIKRSVGKDGINDNADVVLVQKLLNAVTPRFLSSPLKEDGVCGPKTIEAIWAYQTNVIRLSVPDGRVDPGGRSWKALTGATGAFIALPSGDGFYSYMPADTQFGTKATIDSVVRIAKEAKAKIKIDLGVGHISHKAGGPMSGHVSHQTGIDVDFRPLRGDGKRERTNINDPHYSRDKTRKLVEILRGDTNVELIFFNDPQIMGVQKIPGHDDHLHVRFKK